MIRSEGNAYNWIYKLDMAGNRSLFRLICRIMVIITAVPVGFVILLVLKDILFGSPDWTFIGEILLMLVGIIIVVALITQGCYYMLSKSYKGTYVMLFSMNDEGVTFTQTDDQQQINRWIGMFSSVASAASHSASFASGSFITAGSGRVTTRFVRVRKIQVCRSDNLINVSTLLTRNLVYADDEDFDFVKDYIISHCPKAQVSQVS